MTDAVCPVVVATAPGKGFPSGRWLAPWGKTKLLDHVLTQVRSWRLGDGLLVLGHDPDSILDEIDYSGFSVIIDPEWKEGPAASLRTAFDFLQRETDVEAVLVVDASVPTLPTGVVEALVLAHVSTERPAIVPKYRYSLGPPVLLRRWLWPQLVGVERNASLTSMLETHREWVEEVWIDRVPPAEVGNPDDLEDLAPRR